MALPASLPPPATPSDVPRELVPSLQLHSDLKTRISPFDRRKFTYAATSESASTLPKEDRMDPINCNLTHQEKVHILSLIKTQCGNQNIKLSDLELNLFDNDLNWVYIITLLRPKIRPDHAELLTVDNLKTWFRLRIRYYKYRFDNYDAYHNATDILIKWYNHAIAKGYHSSYKWDIVHQPQMGSVRKVSKCPNMLTEWLELEMTKLAARSKSRAAKSSPQKTPVPVSAYSPVFSSSSEADMEVDPPPKPVRPEYFDTLGYNTVQSNINNDLDISDIEELAGNPTSYSIQMKKEDIDFFKAHFNMNKKTPGDNEWPENGDDLMYDVVEYSQDEYEVPSMMIHPEVEITESSTPELVETQAQPEVGWATFVQAAGAHGYQTDNVNNNMFTFNEKSDSETALPLLKRSCDDTPSPPKPSNKRKVDSDAVKKIIPPAIHNNPRISAQRRRGFKPRILRRSTRNKKPTVS